MDQTNLHQAVTIAVSRIFGGHPHRVQLDAVSTPPVATVVYQDFLTPVTMHHTLAALAPLPVQWNFERSMSIPMRHRLLEELYFHPELLDSHPFFHGNVRRYVFHRFAETDFGLQSEC